MKCDVFRLLKQNSFTIRVLEKVFFFLIKILFFYYIQEQLYVLK